MARKSVAKNYIYNLIFQLLTVVTPLITTPYVSRVLGAKNLGIFGYTFSIVTYFVMFASLGITLYGQREIAYVQDDSDKQSRVFWELMVIKTATAALTLAVYWFAFCRHGQYAEYYAILTMEILTAWLEVSWYFQGIEDFSKPVIRNVVIKVLGLVLIFVFVKNRNDLWKYFLVYVLADLLGNATLWFYIPRYIKTVPLRQLHCLKRIGPVVSLFFPQVATQIYTVLDRTMVGNITHDMNEVSYYDQAQKIVKAVLLIVISAGTVMSSRIANCYANHDEDGMKHYLNESVHMVWLTAIPFIFGIIAVSDVFVPWYYGPGYAPVKPLMCATTPILLFIGFSNITGTQYLIQVGRQNQYTASIVAGAAINFCLNWILISHIGTIGAVIATVIAEFSIMALQLWFVRNQIHIRDVLRPAWKYLVSGILMFAVVLWIERNMHAGALMVLITGIVAGAVIYILCLMILRDRFSIGILNMVKQKLSHRHA